MKLHHLLQVFRKVKSANPSIILSGSVGLALQNITMAREPEDLDLYLPFGNDFIPLDGMLIKDAVFYLNNSTLLAEDEYYRISFEYGGKCNDAFSYLKIDVFQPKNAIPQLLEIPRKLTH